MRLVLQMCLHCFYHVYCCYFKCFVFCIVNGLQLVAGEVAKLLSLREKVAKLEKMEDIYTDFNKKAFDELMLRKMFLVPSFEIHNGPAGLFDYGPPACTLKANIVSYLCLAPTILISF